MTENLLADKVARLVGSDVGLLRYAVVRREGQWMGLTALLDSEFTAKRVALASWDDALPSNPVEVYALRYTKGRTHKEWRMIGSAVSSGDGGSEWQARK
jgi:hypothetical protein